MNPANPPTSFKPLKKIETGSRGYKLRNFRTMTLGLGDISVAAKLPKGEDLNEWLAINTIEFYNEINVIYGTVVEFCTDKSCPIMSAGPKSASYIIMS